jgi:hypothetical protein
VCDAIERAEARAHALGCTGRATLVPERAGTHGELRFRGVPPPGSNQAGESAGHTHSRPTSLLKRWLPGNQRQWPASAGHECAAVLGEEEQGEPCPILRIDQRCAHRPAIFPDELHCSLQARRFESAHPHALKSATEDSGMRTSGLYPLLHRVGGTAGSRPLEWCIDGHSVISF